MTDSRLTRLLGGSPFLPVLVLAFSSACQTDLISNGGDIAAGGASIETGGVTSASETGQGGASAFGGTSNSTSSHAGSGGILTTGLGGAATGGHVASAGGVSPTGGSVTVNTQPTGGTASVGGCVDTPRSSESCSDAKSWGFCSQSWFTGYCKATCGTCSATNVGGAPGTGGSAATGGSKVNGGSPATGGTIGTGNAPTTGGNASVQTGGTKATGGTSAATGGSSSNTGATVTRLTNGKDGTTTRYWDCCKPSCGWKANAAQNGKQPTKACGSDGTSVVGVDTGSACSGGSAYQCYNFAPWSVSDTLSYGFAATGGGNGNCGKCYQLDFTGAGDSAAASALSNKTMIVQAINIGGDVASTQFDLLIPGGGVGAFNACSNEWGVSSSTLGAQYGGFLTTCNYTNASCVNSSCTTVFGNKPLLLAGCQWFTGWFNAANNPKIKYAEVACPAAINAKSGM